MSSMYCLSSEKIYKYDNGMFSVYKYRQGQNKMSFQGWQTIPFSDDISHLIILFNVCKGKAKNEPKEMQKYEEKKRTAILVPINWQSDQRAPILGPTPWFRN